MSEIVTKREYLCEIFNYRSGRILYRYNRADMSFAPIPRSLSFVSCDMSRRCPMGQLRNAIKRQPAAYSRAARSELLRARSRHPGPIVGLWGNSDHRRALYTSPHSFTLYRAKITPRKALWLAKRAHYDTHTVSRSGCREPETAQS